MQILLSQFVGFVGCVIKWVVWLYLIRATIAHNCDDCKTFYIVVGEVIILKLFYIYCRKLLLSEPCC